MIFNSLYQINISLVGIIHQIMYLTYQINIINPAAKSLIFIDSFERMDKKSNSVLKAVFDKMTDILVIKN